MLLNKDNTKKKTQTSGKRKVGMSIHYPLKKKNYDPKISREGRIKQTKRKKRITLKKNLKK